MKRIILSLLLLISVTAFTQSAFKLDSEFVRYKYGTKEWTSVSREETSIEINHKTNLITITRKDGKRDLLMIVSSDPSEEENGITYFKYNALYKGDFCYVIISRFKDTVMLYEVYEDKTVSHEIYSLIEL